MQTGVAPWRSNMLVSIILEATGKPVKDSSRIKQNEVFIFAWLFHQLWGELTLRVWTRTRKLININEERGTLSKKMALKMEKWAIKGSITGLMVCLHNSCVEALTPQCLWMWLHLEKAPLKRWVSSKEAFRVGPNPVLTGIFIRKGKDTRKLTHREETMWLKTRREAAVESNYANNLILNFSLQNCEKMNFC